MQYYFTSKLGATRFLLADGSLLCKDVPIARTGEQLYHKSELPEGLEPNDDGTIIVYRSPDEVFRKETIASYEGATVTFLHPDDGVDPDNWQDIGKGHTQNVRQGEGVQSDLLLADLIIKSRDTIAKIDNGIEEISCGYDADYISTGKGKAKQINIIGNHVSFVPDGRAGPRCKIGDSKSMVIKKQDGWLSRLIHAKKTKDADGIVQALEDGGVLDSDIENQTPEIRIVVENQGGKEATPTVTDSDTPLTIEDVKRIINECLDARLSTDADPDKDDGDEKSGITGDSAYTQDSLSRAELIMPGITLPKAMKDSEFKREVLSIASKTIDGTKLIEPLLKGRDIKTIDAAIVDMIFTSASEIKKSSTNKTVDHQYGKNSAQTVRSLQEQINAHWNKGK